MTNAISFRQRNIQESNFKQRNKLMHDVFVYPIWIKLCLDTLESFLHVSASKDNWHNIQHWLETELHFNVNRKNGLNRRVYSRNDMSYLNRLCVKIGDTMDDKNGTKTQLRRRHLQETQYLRDSFQETVRKKTMERTDKWPLQASCTKQRLLPA